MVTTTIPPRMDRSEMERICRLGPDSGACQRAREQHAEWVEHLAANKVENDRIRQAREARQAEEAKTRADAREVEREAAMDALKAGLRDRFFRANPEASPADYARIEQRMLDDEMVRRATDARDADVEGLRRSGRYQM